MLSLPVAVIVNPHARGNWIKQHWSSLEPMLRAELRPEWILFTRAPGDGRVRATEVLRQGARWVVALGGDGTASEVASSLLTFTASLPKEQQLDPPRFSFLACGTGGDLRRTYHTPDSLSEAIAALPRATPRFVDAGRIEYIDPQGKPARSHFINVASFGIGGLVDQLINQSSKRFGGKISYFLAILRATLRYQNAWVRLQLDDALPSELRIYEVAICNGRFFGSGMKIAPEAQVDDGMFDVVSLGDLTLFEAVAMARPTYQGTHLQRSKVALKRVRKLHAAPINPNEKIWLDVDGDPLGCLPATFTILPKALFIQV